jgi:hypothetical protein
MGPRSIREPGERREYHEQREKCHGRHGQSSRRKSIYLLTLDHHAASLAALMQVNGIHPLFRLT